MMEVIQPRQKTKAVISFSVGVQSKENVRNAAKEHGVSMSEFVRLCANCGYPAALEKLSSRKKWVIR